MTLAGGVPAPSPRQRAHAIQRTLLRALRGAVQEARHALSGDAGAYLLALCSVIMCAYATAHIIAVARAGTILVSISAFGLFLASIVGFRLALSWRTLSDD